MYKFYLNREKLKNSLIMKIETLLVNLIDDAFHPSVFEIENESHGHNVAKNSETHFRVVIVSDAFQGLSLVKRHRLVYKVCQEPMKLGLHALAMQCFTTDEWALDPERSLSPPCRGGMKKALR